MENKKRKDSGKVSYIFTRETLGMTVLLFSAIIMVMLLTRSVIFAGIGKAICTFMYGSFGYGSILLIALLAYCGVWLVFEKKIKIKKDILAAFTLFCVVFFLLFHAVATRNIALSGYGGYLSECYSAASAGWSGYTMGGAVCGLLVYPVAKLTTMIGAYVIFSFLLLLCAYLVFYVIRKNLPSKSVTDENSEQIPVPADKGVDYAVETPVTRVNDNLYTVTGTQEIVNNSAVQPVSQQYAEENQPYNNSPYTEQEKPLPTDDDKYSISNLGRKILFENGEFAAESYRRNMVYSEDSYYNHPVTSAEDYLKSFSNGKSKNTETADETGSYTQSYQNDVLNQPISETPANYVFGEKPVEDLNEYAQSFNQPISDTVEPDNSQGENNGTEPVSEQPAEVESDEQQNVRQEPTIQEEAPKYNEEKRADMFGSLRAEQEERREIDIQPSGIEQHEESPKEERKTSGFLSSLFSEDNMRGSDNVRGDRRGEFRASPREERSNADLFDGDDEDVFNVSPRGARDDDQKIISDRAERTDRPVRAEREIPPAQPPARDIGFSLSGDRRGAEEHSKPAPVPEPQPVKEEKPKHKWQKYVRPPLDLLDDYPENNNVNAGEIEDNKRIIVETLNSFKIESEITDVTISPAVTRYDVSIVDKTKTKAALNYRDEIALALMKNNVNTYLNYLKGAISIEVPNSKRTIVGLKSMLVSPKFINCKPNSLTFGLGKNIDGDVVCPDITKMPHLLVAGTTGSGKSICLSTLLISLLYKYGPEELRLILVDPKQAEFIPYNKLPHLMINEILYDVDKVIKALNWAIKEMERRYSLFKEMTENGIVTKTLDEYNSHLPEGEEKLPKILIVLDEFADLMMQAKKDIEGRIIRLAQKSRACGIHLILATQRPSVDCITGLIKSNLPSRIGFKVNSYADSSTIFDVGGAEKLLGMGDLYYRSVDNPELMRVQGCFVDTHEVQKVTDFVRTHNETYFDQEASDFINKVEEPETASSSGGELGEDNGDAKIDDTFIKALKFCVTSNQASVSMIQRRFPVGYIKACKIIDWMENMNYITQSEGSKPRKVLMTKEEFINTFGEIDD